MTLDQFANCHSKAKMGGTIGLEKKEVAHMQWSLTVHERGVITEKTCSMFGMCYQGEPQHKESSNARTS